MEDRKEPFGHGEIGMNENLPDVVVVLDHKAGILAAFDTTSRALGAYRDGVDSAMAFLMKIGRK